MSNVVIGDNKITLTGTNDYHATNTGNNLKDIANLEAGQTYILNFETTYTGNNNNTLYLRGSSTYWSRGTSHTITQEELDDRIAFYGTNNAIISNIMIRISSITDSSYEPYTGGEPAPNPKYPFPIKNTGDNGSVNEKVSNSDGTQEQNLSFPLAEGQKFYEGDYPDDDEKVHHKMGERILDGTENWEETSTATSGKYRWLLIVSNVKATSSTSEIPKIFSTHYKAVAFAGGNGTFNNVQGISVANYGSKIGIYDNTHNTDLTAWKAYLAEQYANGTPVKVVFELAEEQTEDFTEKQKTAWEEWKKARTYKNVTHISSEDETPANVEITYVRDLETVINNSSN